MFYRTMARQLVLWVRRSSSLLPEHSSPALSNLAHLHEPLQTVPDHLVQRSHPLHCPTLPTITGVTAHPEKSVSLGCIVDDLECFVFRGAGKTEWQVRNRGRGNSVRYVDCSEQSHSQRQQCCLRRSMKNINKMKNTIEMKY